MKLAITGLGLVSSIGHDVDTAIAAMRCGIARPIELSSHIFSFDELDTVAVPGMPVKGVTEGFKGLGLYTLLGSMALKDLFRNAELSPVNQDFFKDTGLLAGVSPVRQDGMDVYDEMIEEELAGCLIKAASLPSVIQERGVVASGNCSVFLAIQESFRLIEKKQLKRVIVIGIDSLTGQGDLDALVAMNRLRTPKNQVGLIPGQAASAVLVEDGDAACSRNAMIQGWIHDISAARETMDILDADANPGNGLAGAMRKSLGERKLCPGIYSDINGEKWRALQIGNALTMISSDYIVSDSLVVTPAGSFGDIGAASGAVSICAATRAFNRGYATTDEYLILTSEESGTVVSAMVSAPGRE